MNKIMRIAGFGVGMAAIAIAALWTHGDRSDGATTSSAKPVAKPLTTPVTTLGINLGAQAYYTPQWPFSDVIKTNADFVRGEATVVGGNGFPTNAKRGQAFDTPIDYNTHGRPGTYDCIVSPGWTVQSLFYGSVSGNHDKFKLTIPVLPGGYNVVLRFTADADGATMTQLSCTPTGVVSPKLTPQFMQDMRPFRVIRFMDWMHANTLGPQTWAMRPKPTDVSIVGGASVEDMVDTANALGADPWFTLPFDADDDYYRNFAIYVRSRLAPGHKAYVELSNEVWNSGFGQSQQATIRGKARYPSVNNDLVATDYYYADRVRDMMAIWSSVFAGQMNRIVRVVSSQSAGPSRANDILSHGDTWKSVDALATAPYFSVFVQDIPGSGPERIDKVFAALPAQVEQAISLSTQNKATAYRYGLTFLTYEGGPDISGYVPDAGRDAYAASRDPRMYDIYMDFLRKWQSRVGGVLVLYDSTGGSGFSHNDYTGQPLSETPKMRALADFAKTLTPAR